MQLPVAPKSLRFAGVVACALVILYASITEPGDGIPRTLFGIGFTVYLHLVAYAGVTGAMGYARLSADRRALLVTAFVATLYGIAIELLQGTLSYRTMAAADVLINTVGTVVGAGSWWTIAPVFGVEESGWQKPRR